jgi:uncharacterized protein HemX
MNDSQDATSAGPPDRLSPQGRGDAPSAAGAAPAVAPVVGSSQRASRTGERRLIWGAVLVMLIGVAAGAWFVKDRIGKIEREVVRRDQAAALRAQQLEQQLKLVGDTLREAQGKAAVLESRVAESLGQQSQLRALYDEMARNRGDLALADVESSVMIAAQQLQLAGNVQSALLALQDAEQVLARSNQPATIGLRRVLARDIERLRAVPVADFAAAVARLDAVIAAVDAMPVMSDIGPSTVRAAAGGTVGARNTARPAEGASPADAAPPAAGTAPAGSAPAPTGWFAWLPERLVQTGLQGWEAFVAELRQLVRVQRVDRPEVLLLSAEQRFIAREGLRLQLLNARLNLLARNEPLLRADLGRASATIDRLFDPQSGTVAAAQSSIQALRSTSLAIDLPSLSETIAAVRAARIPGESR